ncbi:MAG: hypothetical protein P9X22_03935 [Candidatus Zapsychrus exili]|nr:hypothetical protein [Candidatus Zapsychrus exili]
MIIEKKETAEQKLLKMIETSSFEGESDSALESQSTKKYNVLTALKLSNKFLYFAVIVVTLFLVNEVKFGTEITSRNIIIPSVKKILVKSISLESVLPTTQNIAFYLFGVKNRNIFQPYEKATLNKVVNASEESKRIMQITQGYKLVGVSWLDDVESASVMIEDTGKGITYFLKKGEKVGDIIVKTIYADSVELGYENEEIIIGYDKPQM